MSTKHPEWETIPLGDVLTLNYGKALPKAERNATGNVPVYGANGIKDHADKALAAGPTLVIGRKGSAGEITRVDGPFWPLDVTYYTEHDESRLDFNFMEYGLRTLDLPSMARGVKPGINRNDVYARTLQLPLLTEQKRIVAVLDQAFAALDRARANAEENLADAGDLQEGTLEEPFAQLASENSTLPLKELVEASCTLSYGIVQPGQEVDGGLPVVRPVDLKGRIVTATGLKTINPSRANSYRRTTLRGGEALLCVRGSTGAMSIAADELAGGNVTRGIVPIRWNQNKILPSFANLQLRSRFVQQQVAAHTYGTALTQINIKDVRELSFVLPPLSVQEEVARRLERSLELVDRLTDTLQCKLTDIAALRQSILQKAFAGELT